MRIPSRLAPILGLVLSLYLLYHLTGQSVATTISRLFNRVNPSDPKIPQQHSTFLESITTTTTSSSSSSIESLHLTSILAHQPGFTLIENAYWQNGVFKFLTFQPWSFPALDHVISSSSRHSDSDSQGHGDHHAAGQIWAIREEALSPMVKEKDQLGMSLSLEQAVARFGLANVLQSPMILTNDEEFIGHYYHWIGEMFLGVWRLWSHHSWLTGESLPPFKTIAFLRQLSADEPHQPGVEVWEDQAGANRWFTERFFPDVNFETKTIWDIRAKSKTLLRIPLAIIADRSAGHRGPSSGYKPWGDVLRLPVSSDYLTQLRDRITSPPIPSSLPIITYLTRQDSTRRLRQEDHEALIRDLKNLEDEGIALVRIEMFNGDVPFEVQVAKIAATDILIAVHGNGLTHTLWMTPGKRKAVFEMQPAWCNINDYSPLATAAGIQHYMVHTDSLCLPLECPPRGCVGDDIDPARGINVDTIEVRPHVITDEIRRILSR